MDMIVRYLFQSSVSAVVLYAIYWIFLRKDTFFSVNRVYLTGSMLFSLLFPAFRFNFSFGGDNVAYAYLLETITISPEDVRESVSAHLTLIRIITIIYLTGASLFFIRFVFQLSQVIHLIRKYGVDHQSGMRFVFVDRNYQPFSFFGLVFLPEKLKGSTSLTQIIEHELVHVRQMHSVDLILLELLTIIQWCNPVIWFYRRSLKSLHEYLADEGVLLKGYDTFNYQELLLNQTMGIQVNDMTNNFNHSLLKNRIMMMTKQRSGHLHGWKAALAIPVAMGLMVVFSSTVSVSLAQEDVKKPQSVDKPAAPPPTYASPASATEEEVFVKVHQAPEFKGGHEGMIAYVRDNVKYPDDSKKQGIQGTVFITFVVNKSGKVTNPVILRGVAPDIDAEALRVVNNMPDWKPGYNEEGKPVSVQINLPIKFKLDDKAGSGEKK